MYLLHRDICTLYGINICVCVAKSAIGDIPLSIVIIDTVLSMSAIDSKREVRQQDQFGVYLI